VVEGSVNEKRDFVFFVYTWTVVHYVLDVQQESDLNVARRPEQGALRLLHFDLRCAYGSRGHVVVRHTLHTIYRVYLYPSRPQPMVPLCPRSHRAVAHKVHLGHSRRQYESRHHCARHHGPSDTDGMHTGDDRKEGVPRLRQRSRHFAATRGCAGSCWT